MMKMFSTKWYALTMSVVLLLALIMASTSASAQVGLEDLMRDNMLLIAESYATYRWKASDRNVQHNNNNIHTPDAETNYLLHPDYNSSGQFIGHTGWWKIWDPDSQKYNINVGIPYFWNGSTAIQANNLNPDLNLELFPIGGKFFDQMVEENLAAGDVTTETHLGEDGKWKQDFSAPEVGVDCVGFINNVWGPGRRAGTAATSGQTRAIQPAMLKPGDILMKLGEAYSTDRTGNHVLLFKEFCSETDPLCNDPDPTLHPDFGLACSSYDTVNDPNDPNDDLIGRMIKVYESSVSTGRVTESIWKIVCMKDYLDAGLDRANTKKLGLERVKAKLQNEWENGWTVSPPNIQSSYIPRTFFQPRDVVIVIDRSGSMDFENRMEQAIGAAKQFIDIMRPGDRIGIVSFDDPPARQEYPLNGADLTHGEIDQFDPLFSTVKIAAKNSLESISPRGGTSIGSGLQKALQLLNTPDRVDRTQLIILLSDGDETVGPTWREIIPPTPEYTGPPVYTVSIGSGNYQTMKDIAEATKGSRYSADSGYWANYVAQSIFPDTYLEKIINYVKSAASSGGTDVQTASIDSAVGSALISVAWQGSDLDVTLVQPDGTVIDPTVAAGDPNIDFVSGATYEFYKISYPQKGTWTVRVFGKSTSGPEEDYSMVVSAADAMILSVDSDRDEYIIGDPVKITASIEDSISDSPLAPEYIHGVTMQVHVHAPNNTEYSFALSDDGLYGDGGANDGVYADTFRSTNLPGSYDFEVQISGNTNRDGQPFTREKTLTVLVVDPPTVVSSLPVFGNSPDYYTNYFNVDYTVTFSEPVTGVDVSDFALTTSGVSGASVSAVSGSGSVYTVTVNTGSGNGTIRLDVIDDDTIKNTKQNKLGGTGIGNANFTTGESYTVDKTARSTIVTKLADSHDGACDADCSLREAIAAAIPGETITFDAALSGGTIHLASTLTLARNITIDGSALAIPITLSGDSNNDGTGDVRVFYVNSGVTATLNSLTLSKGRDSDGGGIYNLGALTINHNTLSNNSATSNGGGIYNNGVLNINHTTFSGNSSAYGGGVFNYAVGIVTINNSTFSNNSATSSGGSLYKYSGTVTVTNSTFSGNSSSVSGGALSQAWGTLTVTNSTLSDNSAPTAGSGIFISNGTFKYSNTIIANSLSGGDCVRSVGTMSTNINNLVEDGSCSALLSGDPNLGALANNGGPTKTMALLAGSPAINAGDDAVCAAAPVNDLDQRGVVRQGLCDIGAYEALDETAPTVLSIMRVLPNATTNYYDVTYDVTFSEPVIGVDSTDFVLTTDGVSGAAITIVSGIREKYTVTVQTGSGSGTIRLDVIDDDTIWDGINKLGGEGAGNGNFTTGQIYTVDKTTTDRVVTKLEDTNDGLCNTDCSLREAIAASIAGDTITFGPSLSGQTIPLTSTLTLTRNVTIDGSALAIPVNISGDTNNDGTGDIRIFYVNSGVVATLNRLTLSKGRHSDGGGVYNLGALMITNVIFTGNSASFGGGIFNDGNLTLENTTFSGNSVTAYGAGIYNNGNLTVENTSFSNNSASYYGGGVYNDYNGTLSITHSTFLGNTATRDGGAIYNDYNNGNATISYSTFSGNTAGMDGGGILNYDELTITDSTFSGNSADDGGGIYNDYSSDLTISKSTFSNNSASFGGGIENVSNLMVNSTNFSGNSATEDGGGIYNNGELTITQGTFTGNSAAGEGGGIINDDSLTITNSTFLDNSAAYGGGIGNNYNLTVTNSTFSSNSSTAEGGGILNYGDLTITNSTISGNASDTFGGGTYNDWNLYYANTIIANSTSGGDCFNGDTIGTNTRNLVEDGSCSAFLSGDPNLGPLANNGSFTQTMALLAGSLAIDAGDDAVCAAAPVNNLDQRGIARPQGSHCDIGAYEFSNEATPTPTDTPTHTPTATSTPTPTSTATATATLTPTFTPTSTPTNTPTNTPTSTPTFTPTATPTDTPTAIPSNNFPATGILDNFNRANGSIGSNWSGNTNQYIISSNQMNVDDDGANSDIYWSNEAFGADQEAYVTFTHIDPYASEQDLLLKAQSNSTWGDGVLEVCYDPAGQRVQVWTWEWPEGWVQHGEDIPITFADGDTFGARALADGTVEVYKNGTLLETRDITTWSHYADGGYIGLWFIGAEDAVLDDFGGGTLPGGEMSMSLPVGPAEGDNLTPEQLNVNLNTTMLFWQGVPLGSNQQATVTFANIPAMPSGVFFKPQSNGVWGESVVQVLYDVAGGRIQVWVYQPENGWVQYGKDVPVKFVDGNVFSVHTLVDGTVEIYRNGKLLAKRDVIP